MATGGEEGPGARRSILAWLLVLAALWVVVVPRAAVRQRTSEHNYFQLLAQAFLQGRATLDESRLRSRFDLSVHEGKYSLYWGPMPAAFFLPFEAVAPGAVSDQLVTRIVVALGILAWWRILLLLSALAGVKIREGELLLLAGFSLFGTQVFHLGSYCGVWQQAHLFGFLLLSASLFFGLRARGAADLRLASALFAAALLCRYSLAVLAPAYYAGLWFWFRRMNPGHPLPAWRRIVELAAPAAAGVAIMLAYNHARYDSALEFGHRYQVQNPGFQKRMDLHGRVSTAHLGANVSTYLVDPLKWTSTYPFLVASQKGNAIWSYQLDVWIALLALAWWALRGRHETREGPRHVAPLVIGSGLAWLSGFVFLLFFYATGTLTFGGRYLVDMLPFHLVIVILSFLSIRHVAWMRIGACALMAGSVAIEFLSTR